MSERRKIPVDPRERLRHIETECDVLSSVASKVESVTDLYADPLLSRTAERCIFVIGEAANSLPESVKKLSPSTDWRKVRGTRNVPAHEYFNIKKDIVWEVVTVYAPSLRKEVVRLLEQLNREEYAAYREVLSDYSTDCPSYFTRIKQQEKLDVEIAKKILAEYPAKFQKVAIAKIKDIISVGERATEIRSKEENISIEGYVGEILQSALGDNGMDDKDLSKGAERE